MPLRWLFVLVAVGIFYGGAQEFWVGIHNLSPTAMTCPEYVAKRPSAAWLDLSDCHINYLESVKTYKQGKFDKSKEKDVAYYTPVRASEDANQPVILVVKATSEIAQLLSSLESASAGSKVDDETLKKNAEHLVQRKVSIKGVVALGMSSDNDLHNLLETSPQEGWQLASDWKIIDTEGKYSVLFPLLMMIGSFAFLVWQWKSLSRRVDAEAAASQAVAETEAPQKISDIAKQSE